MLYECAITPDVFDATSLNNDPRMSVVLVQLLRDILANGTLANLHAGYFIRHIRESRIEKIDQKTKTKVISYLNMLKDRHRLVSHPYWTKGDPVTDQDWLNVTLESHRHIPFFAVVLSQALLATCKHTDPALIEQTDILSSPLWSSREVSVKLTKCEADYRFYLQPILRHARRIDLIDPYIHYNHPKWLKTVEICAELMGKQSYDASPGRIYIHTSPRNGSVDALLEAWGRKLQPLADTYQHRFTVYIWGPQDIHQLHNRYILTDQCGIMSGDSLECITYMPRVNVWSLLDEKVRIELYASLNPSNPRFKLLGQRKIVKS